MAAGSGDAGRTDHRAPVRPTARRGTTLRRAYVAARRARVVRRSGAIRHRAGIRCRGAGAAAHRVEFRGAIVRGGRLGGPPFAGRPGPGRGSDNPGHSTGTAIEFWGAPRSGKSTFLRALEFAADEPVFGYRWKIIGRDKPSRDFLTTAMRDRLDGDLPAASTGDVPLSWTFRGRRHREAEGTWLSRLMSAFGDDDDAEPDAVFTVDVHDLPGELFGRNTIHTELREQMLNRLVAARGIVLLFDPIGTKEADSNAFDYYLDIVGELRERVEQRKGLCGNGQLPHHLSVCVTKLDDARVFEAAMDARMIYDVESGTVPEVPAELAADLLRQLCEDDRSERLCIQLAQDFLPSRTRYFATTAAGFRVVNGRFDRNSPSTVEGKRYTAKGKPVNVLEPIVSLHQRIAEESGGL
ncbi:hypothetical protein [Nocardia asteroides]|uniref:hypothetical protein n=1 Tax=Nocardia asteroides TaxID=1824 RepID=UPI001E3E3089|nr:hypothetical protein [Nocardia asteroides]UGT62491.1 hypothetical protein LTT61_03845 [Nocardia asteroides]